MKNVVFAIIVMLSCATMSYAGTCCGGSCPVKQAPVVEVVVTPARTAVSVVVSPVKKVCKAIRTHKPVRKVLKRIFVR